MKRTKSQFFSCLWSVGLFVLSAESLVAEGCASDFEEIPKAKASLEVELVEDEIFREFDSITRFVGDRSKKNFDEAVVEVELFLEENLGEDLFGGELTQLKTFSKISQGFYEKQGVDSVDLYPIKKIVLMLRPYEVEIGDEFLDLQGFYREILLRKGKLLENAVEDFLVEARSVFYTSNNFDRPYLLPDQANWVLRLAKEYDIGGNEFQGYLDRAVFWKKKQKKRELLSGSGASDGYSSSITSSSDEALPPKRKWGNKGFHSHTGKPKYKSGKKMCGLALYHGEAFWQSFL